jgi:hypothetical protein
MKMRIPETYDGDIIEEAGPCRHCDGTGLFAKKTWHEPEIRCDECNGTGYDAEDEERIQKIKDGRRKVWGYFLEDQEGRLLTTGVWMTEEEVQAAQSFLDDQGLDLRWHPMDPD